MKIQQCKTSCRIIEIFMNKFKLLNINYFFLLQNILIKRRKSHKRNSQHMDWIIFSYRLVVLLNSLTPIKRLISILSWFFLSCYSSFRSGSHIVAKIFLLHLEMFLVLIILEKKKPLYIEFFCHAYNSNLFCDGT